MAVGLDAVHAAVHRGQPVVEPLKPRGYQLFQPTQGRQDLLAHFLEVCFHALDAVFVRGYKSVVRGQVYSLTRRLLLVGTGYFGDILV